MAIITSSACWSAMMIGLEIMTSLASRSIVVIGVITHYGDRHEIHGEFVTVVHFFGCGSEAMVNKCLICDAFLEKLVAGDVRDL